MYVISTGRSEIWDGSEIAQGTAEYNFAILATTSGIYPKFHSCLSYVSQINTIAFIWLSDFHIRFHTE